MVVAPGALAAESIRVLGTAGVAPSAVGHAEHRVASARPALGAVVEPDLGTAPSVEGADRRVGTIGAACRCRRQEDVRVDLGSVEAVSHTAAEPHPAAVRLRGTGCV